MPWKDRTYTQAEVSEIIERALRAQNARSDSLSHDDLVEVAAEVGIDSASLDGALEDISRHRLAQEASTSDRQAIRAAKRKRWQGLAKHAASYALVNGALYFTLGLPRMQWLLVGWGIGLAFHLRAVLFFHPDAGWCQRRAWKEQRRAERDARRAERWAHRKGNKVATSSEQAVEQSTHEFEAAVQQGVAALLSVAARKIQEHAQTKTSAPPATANAGKEGRSPKR
jgi:hypothetical protein